MTTPIDTLDLRGIPCPRNATMALLHISMMDEQELLEILLDDGDPITNVPESLELDGHSIKEKQFEDGQYWKILVVIGGES